MTSVASSSVKRNTPRSITKTNPKPYRAPSGSEDEEKEEASSPPRRKLLSRGAKRKSIVDTQTSDEEDDDRPTRGGNAKGKGRASASSNKPAPKKKKIVEDSDEEYESPDQMSVEEDDDDHEEEEEEHSDSSSVVEMTPPPKSKGKGKGRARVVAQHSPSPVREIKKVKPRTAEEMEEDELDALHPNDGSPIVLIYSDVSRPSLPTNFVPAYPPRIHRDRKKEKAARVKLAAARKKANKDKMVASDGEDGDDDDDEAVPDNEDAVAKSARLPPLFKIEDIFADLTKNVEGLEDFAREMMESGEKLKVATMCSGTESPLLALSLISRALKAQTGVELKIDHGFSCEIEPYKQAYIERNFAPPILFADVTELGDLTAHNAYGAKITVPIEGYTMLIAGTSCVDFSNLNKTKKDMAAKGESGRTWAGMLAWVKKARPWIVILENVVGAPWDQMVDDFEDIGYAAESTRFDTKNYYIPHTRSRGYQVCFRKPDWDPWFPNAKSITDSYPAAWETMVKSMQRPSSAPLEAFLLPSDDPRIHQARLDLSKKTLLALDEKSRAPKTPEELACIRELLLKHIRISAPPALAVIIDNLCSPESDDKKKETLLDILEVEGRIWIKKDCMEPMMGTGEENEDGKLLREGLEQVLRSSPPPHLLLKIYRLLAPLPHTSSSLPASILLLRPPSKESYLLAFSCAQPPDPRAVVLNWYEGGSVMKEGGEVEELRDLCKNVRKWWEEERERRRRGRRGGGVVGEGQEWEEKNVRERWREVEEGLVSMLAARVVTYWKQAKSSSGMTSRPIPFPLMESLLMTLAYLSEIPNVHKSQITNNSEFCRNLLDQPTESPWKSAIGAIKKSHDNYGELLAWFRASRHSSGSKPLIPRLTPSWELVTPSSSSSSSSNHRDSNFKDSRRTFLLAAETTYIDPPPRAQPSSLSIPRNSTNGSLASRLSGNGVAAGTGGGAAAVKKPMVGGEDRKRKFAAASGGASEVEKPGKKIAAPQSAPGNGRRKSSSPTSDMDGIVALPGRPSNFPSSSTPSLLNRISDSSTTNGHAARASPITLFSSPNSSFFSGNNNGSSLSNSRIQRSGRASPSLPSSSTSTSFIPAPPPHLQPTPVSIPNPPPRTSTFNIVIPNSEIRHQPPHLARQLSSSNSLSAFTTSRQPPLPPHHSPLPPPTPTVPAATAPAAAPSFLPTSPRSDSRPIAFDPYDNKNPQPSYHHQPHGVPSHPQGPPGLSHLPFHPDYRGPPPLRSQVRPPLQLPPRISKQGLDLISSFQSPTPTSLRKGAEDEANPNKGLNVRGRAKARAPPAYVPEPEPESEEVWEEQEEQEEEIPEDWGGAGGGGEEVKQTSTTTLIGRGLLGRMS